MKFVLDVSAALPPLIDADAQSWQLITSAELIVAPELFYPELANALWKYVKFEKMSQKMASFLLKRGIALVDVFISHEEYIEMSFNLSVTHGITVYDGLYLALSQMKDFPLITEDQKLQGIARKMGLNAFT